MYLSDLSEPSLACNLKDMLSILCSPYWNPFWKAVNSSHFTAHLLTQLDWSCSPLGGGLSEPEGKEGWAQYIPCSTSCHQTYSSSLWGTMSPDPFTLCTLMRQSDIFHDRWWGCGANLRGFLGFFFFLFLSHLMKNVKADVFHCCTFRSRMK